MNFLHRQFPVKGNKMSNEPKLYPINDTVIQINQISFHGDVIPHQWFQFIRYENGKPDQTAITLLAHFVYWYRPVQLLENGRPVLYRKFKGDLLQKSYKQLTEHFGFTTKQCKSAFYTLERLGLAKRMLKTISVNGVKCSNVMFIELDPEKIKQITDIQCSQPCSQPPKKCSQPPKKLKESLPYGLKSTHPMDFKVHTNTETTPETTQSLKNIGNISNRDCGKRGKKINFKKEIVSLSPSDLKRRFSFSDQQIDLVKWIEKVRYRAKWNRDQLDDEFIVLMVFEYTHEQIEDAINKTTLKNPDNPGGYIRSLLPRKQKDTIDYRAENVKKAEEFKKLKDWNELKITKSQCAFVVKGKKIVFKNDIDPKHFEMFLGLKYDEFNRMKKDVA